MNLSSLISNESKVVFVNGEVVEGAEQVAEMILTACVVFNKAYRQAYRQALLKSIGKGAAVGLVLLVGSEIYIYRKKKSKLKLEQK